MSTDQTIAYLFWPLCLYGFTLQFIDTPYNFSWDVSVETTSVELLKHCHKYLINAYIKFLFSIFIVYIVGSLPFIFRNLSTEVLQSGNSQLYHKVWNFWCYTTFAPNWNPLENTICGLWNQSRSDRHCVFSMSFHWHFTHLFVYICYVPYKNSDGHLMEYDSHSWKNFVSAQNKVSIIFLRALCKNWCKQTYVCEFASLFNIWVFRIDSLYIYTAHSHAFF